MTKQLRITGESIRRLASCHADIIRVVVRTAKITGLRVLRGAITVEEAAELGGLDSKELHRPSDAVTVFPDGAHWPREPHEMAALDTEAQEAIRAHVRNVAAWWYLGGVVTGVAETLHDQRIIDQPVMWTGIGSRDNSGLARIERGY